MEKRDYLKDQIEQFGRVLRALIDKLLSGESTESLQLQVNKIDEQFTEIFGVSPANIDHLPNSATQPNHELIIDMAKFYDNSASIANHSDSIELLNKALKFAELAQSIAPGYSIEYQDLIASIRNKLN